jgi:hypothetical protein
MTVSHRLLSVSHRDSGTDRILADLVTHETNSIARLSTLCINLLISPRPPNNLPPLLDTYDWGVPVKGEPHPLLDMTTLGRTIPSIPERYLPGMLQALRSAGNAYKQLEPQTRRNSTSTVRKGSRGSHRNKIDPFPQADRHSVEDDAETNPYYYPCPSPRHLEINAETWPDCRPDRHVFLYPAEERVEWRTVHGWRMLPVRWQGCSPGCLAFLEQDEEESWSLDEDL